MDPLQFSYRAGRRVENATLTLSNLISGHKYLWSNCSCVLYRAFSTVQPHVLIHKLSNLEINSDLVLWISQFLCGRPQRVNLNSRLCSGPVFSNELTLNTGVPKGCVLSPFLFSIYTNDISCNNPVLTLIQFADDMALAGHLKDEFSLSRYYLQIELLNSCFRCSCLELNMAKPKDLVLG